MPENEQYTLDAIEQWFDLHDTLSAEQYRVLSDTVSRVQLAVRLRE